MVVGEAARYRLLDTSLLNLEFQIQFHPIQVIKHHVYIVCVNRVSAKFA